MKNCFQKVVPNPNWSNFDKNDNSDYCKECKEYYYVIKEECDWIKCSVCEKWLHENCTIFSKTCIDCGRNNRSRNLKNVRNLQRSKKEPHSDTEHRLFYLITILSTTNLLFCIALYVGHLSPRICQRRPFAYLCNFYCCQ
jgi:hypothetical protein